MTSYEIFSFITCFTVFAVLSAIFGFLIYHLVKDRVRLIGYGEFDGEIIKEYEESQNNNGRRYKVTSYVINAVASLLFVTVFAFSIVVNIREDSFSDNMPTLRVVLSDSMSKKLDSNCYLTQNELNDQFQTYDIILTYKIPDEFELKLYDIVVYEVDEKLIVHRIVAIEEPNEQHPNHRYFTLQGDAVGNIDRFPVLYSQMRGIYRGERIMFLGSFVKFLQSPAGWLCLVLVIGSTLLSPLVDKYVDKHKKIRLASLGYITLPEKTDTDDKENNR